MAPGPSRIRPTRAPRRLAVSLVSTAALLTACGTLQPPPRGPPAAADLVGSSDVSLGEAVKLTTLWTADRVYLRLESTPPGGLGGLAVSGFDTPGGVELLDAPNPVVVLCGSTESADYYPPKGRGIPPPALRPDASWSGRKNRCEAGDVFDLTSASETGGRSVWPMSRFQRRKVLLLGTPHSGSRPLHVGIQVSP